MGHFPWRFHVGMASEQGAARAFNADGAAYFIPPPALLRHGVLFAVADGVGGGPCSALAAHVALRAFFRAYYRGRGWSVDWRLRGAVRIAHHAVRRQAAVRKGCEGMATTLTGLLCTKKQLRVVHVGDAHAFLVRDRAIHRITREHTMGAALRSRLGRTSPRYQNVLSQALGLDTLPHPDVVPLALKPGDILILATDGVHRAVQARHMGWFALRYAPLQAAALMARYALTAGSRDDRSVLVVRVAPAVARVVPSAHYRVAARAHSWA